MEIPDYIKTAMKEIAENENIRNYKLHVDAGSNKGDNYIGVILRIVLTGEKNGENIQLSLICKLAPDNEIRREKFQVVECFKREFEMYEKILPEFTKIQEKIPKCDRFRSNIKYYKLIKDEFKETLIMEDLKLEGLVMWDRKKPLDLTHTKLVLQQLGKFHGTSFAIRDQHPEIFQEFLDIEDVVFSNREVLNELASYFDLFVLKAINTLGENETLARDKMEKFRKNYVQHMFEGVSNEKSEPHSAVCHGDCWTNNMLFKYQNNIVTEMCLLDWQIARTSSPVTDTSYFIFCCTDKELRDNHYDDLMKYYHDSLCQQIEALGSDPEKLFPFTAFQDHLKRYSAFGLGMAIYDLPNVLSNPDDIKDLDDMANAVNKEEMDIADFDGLTEETAPIYKQRMSDVIMDCVRYGYL